MERSEVGSHAVVVRVRSLTQRLDVFWTLFSDEFWQLAWREVEADETGEDPVRIDEVPPNVDDIRTRTADVDRLTPAEATEATLQRGADRTRSDPEIVTRKEL